MNYNASSRLPSASGPKKPKRVSDVNAMGAPAQSVLGNAGLFPPGAGANSYISNNSYDFQQYTGYSNVSPQQTAVPSNQQAGGGSESQFVVFQQPIVQDMALQYGQKLATHGKELVNTQFEKYVPVTKLKYYFAVDNKYVINKLTIIFFPFSQTDWSLKYDHDNPVQPRYDINAPDLYIPTMAYITYVVLAGLVLGFQNRFSPEQLGIQASSALAYSIFELVIYMLTLYIANISTTLKTLDLLALSGYKYASIVLILLCSICLKKIGYYLSWLYASASLAFFLLRTLKAKVLSEPAQTHEPPSYDPYRQQQQQFEHNAGRKRKLYFLFLVTGLQPLLAFWLSMHLIPNDVTA